MSRNAFRVIQTKYQMKPKARNREILIQELENEVLIYDLKINKAFSLNETCAMVWRVCDGVKDIDEIAQKLSFKTKELVNKEVVWLALESLKKENLLVDEIEIPKLFNGLNRREVIRKVGFATMVAIPVITSLIAPTAANAQSGSGLLALNSLCSTNNQCASGFCTLLAFTSTRRCCGSGVVGLNLPPGSLVPTADCSPSNVTPGACCSNSYVPSSTPGICACA